MAPSRTSAQPHPPPFGAALPRLWTAELVLRPLGTNRLEVALGAAHADGDDWDRRSFRARVCPPRVIDGVRLYAEGESVPARIGAGASAGGSDTRLAFGLAIDFDHTGAVVGVPVLVPGSGSAGAGIAAARPPRGRAPPGAGRPGLRGARARSRRCDDDRDFFQLVRRLRALAVDPAAVGVLLRIEIVNLGYGRIEELRDLVALLRAQRQANLRLPDFSDDA